MHLAWDFPPGPARGPDWLPASPRAGMLVSPALLSSCCERRPAAQINPTLVASLGRTNRLQPDGYGWMLSVVAIAILANVLQV